MARRLVLIKMAVLLFVAVEMPARCGVHLGDIGKFAKWSRIEIALEGPMSDAAVGKPNPFLIETAVEFEAPRGKLYRVPAYFDGDGKGGLKGSVWKVRFSADQLGRWRFRSVSADRKLDGYSGWFEVVAPSADAPVFQRWGRLQFVGQRYLKFADGPYWLKGGTDSPENFLGKAMGDWTRKKSQVDYLARQRVNCMYIMTQNIGGDGRDVWPWIGQTEQEARNNHQRFDVARLRLWQDMFEYIQSKGIVIQIVLNDDSAWLGYDHRLYLREMVARFGYLPAIYWNIGEEYAEAFKSFDAAQRYARLLARLDPYRHPIALHNVNEPSEALIRDPDINVTSIQTQPVPPRRINVLATDWLRLSKRLRLPVVVSFDEGRPPMDRRSVWAAYLGGAMWEAIDTELMSETASFEKNERFWKEMLAARKLLESLPFWEMEPDNRLAENGFCLAKKGEIYLIYSPSGERVGLNLREAEGKFQVRWYNPATGRFADGQVKEVRGGRFVSLGRAPFDGDAAVLVKKVE